MAHINTFKTIPQRPAKIHGPSIWRI